MIFHETALQPRLFLLLLCAGFVTGVSWDLLGLIRSKTGSILGAFLDGAWCVFASALCFLSMLISSAYQFRLFAPLSMALGAALYALGIRRVGRKVIFFLSGRKKSP